MSEDDDGGGGAGRAARGPREAVGTPLSPGCRRHPTTGTHSSRRQDHTPQAAQERPSRGQCAGSPGARPPRAGTFKSRWWAWPVSPAPCAAPRPLRRAPRIPGASLRCRGRWAGGCVSRPPAPGSRLKDRETKGRNPASSCCFPPARPATSHVSGPVPPALPLYPVWTRQFPGVIKSWKRRLPSRAEAGVVPSGNSPASTYPSHRGRLFS